MEILDKILGTSSDLFRQYGFKSITMDDIARRSGISKKTLYQHFANKNEVVIESVIWYKQKVSDQCERALSASKNPVEGMVRLMNIFDHIHRSVNPIALRDLERYYPEGFQLFLNILGGKDLELIMSNLLMGKEQGYYRSDLNIDFAARYRMEVSLLAVRPTFLISDESAFSQRAYLISEHFLYGIMTPKGEKIYQKYKEQYFTKSNL